MHSEFTEAETGTPSKKRKVNSGWVEGAEYIPSSLDIAAHPELFMYSTQENLFQAGTEDVVNSESNSQCLYDPLITIPESTLGTLISSLNAVNATVKTLNDTVIKLSGKVRVLSKKSSGLKKVIKAMYIKQNKTATRNTSDNQPAPPPPQTASVSDTSAPPTSSHTQPTPRFGNKPNRSSRKDDDIWTLKKKVVPQWGKKYFHRTGEFGRSYTNYNRARILNSQISSNPPYIPPKFRKQYARDPDHHKILERKSISDMKLCWEETKHNSNIASTNMTNTDNQVIDQINRHQNITERTQLLALWEKETTAGETHMKQKSARSLQWLENLPTEKPYHGFASCQKRSNIAEQYTENSGANGAHGGFQRYWDNQHRRNYAGPRAGGGRPWERRGRQDFW